MSVWGGTTENILKPLILQQNKTIRICHDKKKIKLDLRKKILRFKELELGVLSIKCILPRS